MSKKEKTMVEGALGYQKIGWSVLAMEPGGKKPYHNWKENQTKAASPASIKKRYKKWPDAGVGVATGALSGIIVLDFDSMDALERWQALYGDLPETIISKTGRGIQAFFKYPNNGTEIRNQAGVIPDVDVRGEGGLTVLPPSIHKTGVEYAWINIDPVENGLVDLLPLPGEYLKVIQNGSKPQDTGGKAKDKLTSDPVPNGKRNETLARLVGRWVLKNGNDFDDTLDRARTWNRTLDKPMDDSEVVKTVRYRCETEAQTAGLNDVNDKLGLTLEKIIFKEYLDGEAILEIRIKGIDGEVLMDMADLDSPAKFRRRMMTLTRKVIPRYTGKVWDKISQGILDAAEVVRMSFDESDLGTLCEIISAHIKREFDEPQRMMHSYVVVVDEIIYLKMTPLQNELIESNMHIIARSTKKIGHFLRKIGFKKGTWQVNGVSMGKVWRMNKVDFEEFLDEV